MVNSTKDTPKRGLIASLIYIYFIIGMIFTPWFNWRYAKENGFVAWLFMGEVIATGKALAWPYFIFKSPPSSTKPPNVWINTWTQEEFNNLDHFRKSREFDIQASALQRTFPESQGFESQRTKQVLELKRKAFLEAVLVRDDVLDKVYQGLAKVHNDTFRHGLELQVAGLEAHDPDRWEKGSALHNQWVEWAETNKARVLLPRQPSQTSAPSPGPK